MHTPAPSRRRFASACLVGALAVAVVPLAQGADTDLSDVPLSVQSGVKPNVLFILDNSGSMEWGSITGTDATAEFNRSRRAYYSPTFNRLYYNPAITYRPPVQYDAGAPNFTRPMAASNPQAARTNPFLNSRTVDLSTICWGSSSGTALPRYSDTTFGATSGCGDSPGWFRETPYTRYAFYYRWVGTGTEDGSSGQNNGSNYEEVWIDPDIATYPKASTRTDCGSGSTCTYEQEMQNFANWFSYYRTRMQTAKTALGLAFAGLDDKSRVGFATINDNRGRENRNGSFFVALGDFGSAQKQRWFDQLYDIVPDGGTPLVEALDRAGRYYKSGSMEGAGGTRSDTVPLSCTPNYAILSTDGYWTSNDASVGNTDDTVPDLPANIYNDPATGVVRNDPVSGTPLVPGEQFPAPFYGGSGSRNTLADVAMQYWIEDLTGNSAGQVQANLSDPATWQHMTTYTIGLGASGTLSAPPTGTEAWPNPRANEATAIDDLWHAALNGHGQYFNSPDPERLRTSLGEILNDIVNRSGSASAATVSNPNVQAGDNVAFTSTFNSGAWYGDLEAFAIDLTTGMLSATPLWSAQARLDAKPFGTRLIASFDGTQGVPFTPTAMASQLDRLNSPTSPPGPGDGAAVIAYLRGDRSGEGDGSDAARPYRQRLHLLGDVVNAEASYVSAPRSSYTDDGYAAYKSGVAAARTRVVYQGANDGMLHAFNAETGEEMWAYVPGALLSEPLSASSTGTSALVGLTQQSLFRHRYFVDATPTATDVDLSNTSQYQPAAPAPQWATVLTGGLGKGGRGYYALNVTDPAATSDDAVAAKLMWEFPNAGTSADTRNNIGYSYGSPVTVKTRAAGWVTLVTSGYNNGSATGGDGRGRLFVLDTATGEVLQTLTTPAGSSSTPSGLARISAYLVSPGTDDTVDFVYGGDLLGNVWRFDLSGDTASSWTVALLATLVDGLGNPQPITEAPELGMVSGKRMVFVGTGRYLGASDIPGNPGANANATQRQSFYGLVDDRSITPAIVPLRSQLVAQSATPSNNGEINLSSNPVNLAIKRGWVLDFAPSPSGERSTTNPVLFAGVLSFTTNTPSGDACSPGGSSNLYFLDYSTGGAQGDLVSRFVGNVLSSRVQPIGLPGGGAKILVRTSDGGTRVYNVAAPSSTTPTRVMWREVVRE